MNICLFEANVSMQVGDKLTQFCLHLGVLDGAYMQQKDINVTLKVFVRIWRWLKDNIVYAAQSS